MSDLIRKIGELTVNATIDYNEKAAALEAANKKYLTSFGAADRARVEAKDAALSARDAAVNAAWDAYDAAIAAAEAKFDQAVEALDQEIDPFQKAEEAAKLNFDKARAAWAAVVDDVAIGGLDDGDDDDGEEIEAGPLGVRGGVDPGPNAPADGEKDEEEAVLGTGEHERQPEGVVTDGKEVGKDESQHGEAVVGLEEDAPDAAEPTGWPEAANEAALTDGFLTPVPAPTPLGGGEEVQAVSPGPSDATQGATPQEEVTSQATEVANVTETAPIPEVTITGTLTVGDTVAEPAPAVEAGGVEPPVVEPSVSEGSGEPAAAPLTDPLPAVEAAPEPPATFPVEYADVPVPLVEDLPLDGTVVVTEENKPAV